MREHAPTSASDLRRQAARLGPGYRGRRRAPTEEERKGLIAAFQDSGADPPPYLSRETEWIERRAKLFEAGDYPDKGVSIDAATLRGLERSFDLPVPVLIEHAESPLELGYLVEVEADGSELVGTVALSAEANALIERSGAQFLSLGLSAELDEIREVSLVRNPRVPDARLFFSEPLEAPDGAFALREKVRELQAERRKDAAARQVDDLVREGRLTPAEAPFAAALLESDDTVAFGSGRSQVSALVGKLLQARPKLPLFGEAAPSAALPDPSSLLMLPEEAEFYRRYFPDVSLESIAAKR